MSRGVGKVPPLQLVDFMQKQQNGLGGGLRWTPAANPRAKARHRGSVGNSLQGVHFGVGHVPGGKWHLNSVLEASTHPRPPPPVPAPHSTLLALPKRSSNGSTKPLLYS